MDSQIVKCADTVGKGTRGYYGGKKITGRGRHLADDVEGWLLSLVITAASVSDRAGLKLLVIRLFNAAGTLQIMWADSGYEGAPTAAFVKTAAAITLAVVKRTSPHPATTWENHQKGTHAHSKARTRKLNGKLRAVVGDIARWLRDEAAKSRDGVSSLGLDRSGLRGSPSPGPLRPGSWPSGARTPGP